MIKVNEIKLPICYSDGDVVNALSCALRVRPSDITHFEVVKRSIDSRKKDDIHYTLSIAVDIKEEGKFLAQNRNAKVNQYTRPMTTFDELMLTCAVRKTQSRPVIVGSGPCGLFAGLTLAKAGLRPIILERGKDVDARKLDVEKFYKSGQLNTESNIQFGEGGAGAFSDGKLNTGVGGDMISLVLNEFVANGANANILFDSKPHIGSDILVQVVKNMRKKIIELGGEFHFQTRMTDFLSEQGKLTCVLAKEGEQENDIQFDTNACILAIGHSSRDTFELLAERVRMEQKPFSIGVRIEHLQKKISLAQYGKSFQQLPPADYKLAEHLDNGRSCYTFCMCPGGYVMPATSEKNCVVTNGMSMFARDGANANSALLVGVETSDFGSDNVLAGVEFQRKYERLAYSLSDSYRAPCQTFGDFCQHKSTQRFGEVLPSYKLGVAVADLHDCLPPWVSQSIEQGVKAFDRKIKGFADCDSLLTGVETRSSSPVKILRDENGNSSLLGLMPCGEGAGYAGGIISAAIDGIRVALKYINNI
ncbi:MAG: hypothetical protein RR993_00100 [Clostridia bacterium]